MTANTNKHDLQKKKGWGESVSYRGDQDTETEIKDSSETRWGNQARRNQTGEVNEGKKQTVVSALRQE
jgi:hypothetical protein